MGGRGLSPGVLRPGGLARAAALGLALAGVPGGKAGLAEPPKSAIDWLSESLLQPPNFVITPPDPAAPGEEFGRGSPAPITSQPLAAISRDAVGVLPPGVTGFPRAIWGDMPPEAAARQLAALPAPRLPAVAALFKQFLLAQSDPPQAPGPEGVLLLARIDRLFTMGALDEAETLIRLAGVRDPETFRRWFAIGLIGQRTNAPCAALRARPMLSDDIATRTICLARAGDWNAAAITVSLGESLGQISQADADLLVRFLDPEMFAGLPDGGNPDPLDPITFTLREALALPRPETPLPLPYLNADLSLRSPARQRIMAAERLVRAGAIAPNLLFAAYRGARAAASGGAWGRAALVQALDAALVSEDDAQLAAALSAAFAGFAEAGLLVPFAAEYGYTLAHFPPAPETAAIAADIRALLLLAGQPPGRWAGLGPEDPAALAHATRLARGDPLPAPAPVPTPAPAGDDTPLFAAIRRAFADTPPPRQALPALLARVEAGNFAEGMLLALTLLAPGHDAGAEDIHTGLFLLRRLGQDRAARKVAIELLLLPAPEAQP